MQLQPTADHVRQLMRTMNPGVDAGSEHPMTAVGTVLLAAAMARVADEGALVSFTGYPRPFIAAILFNLQGNRVLDNGSYDCSEWLSSEGAISEQGFWDHVEVACGNLWLQEVDFDPLDACQIYWNNKELS